MTFQVDIWLRGEDSATTRSIEGVPHEPCAWTDNDVRLVLEGMLQAMHRLKHPRDADTAVALRGLSWIVNPFENGVVIAIEIRMGAAVAGPFDVDKATLEMMVERVLGRPESPTSAQVH
jgi:hypothetical protein